MTKIIFLSSILFLMMGASQSSVADNKAPAYPSDSIFWLDSTWTRFDGKEMKLSDLGETPVVLSMVFLGCKYTCPLTVNDMREMEQKISKGTKASFKMVLISIDPERDTPEAMRKFMTERKLNPERWILLSSTPENVRELAATLGYSYKKDKAMDFAHSMLTWVFDKDGVKRFTRSARKESVDETVEAFKKVSG